MTKEVKKTPKKRKSALLFVIKYFTIILPVPLLIAYGLL